ncbi:MAG: rhamnulokinase family protein [Planctomycetia bacterium]|nr:rhamnulokinase family protein [Planctomycetia bacterium]
MATKSYLAIDMGASSGRHVVGNFDGQRLELDELYRFENGPVAMIDSFFWDLPGLWSHVQKGLAVAANRYPDLTSVGVDTWGVDFAFLTERGELLGNPYCYRDARTDGAMERAFAKVPRETIFSQTGLQFMQFNSLFQLFVMKEQNSPFLDLADRFLMMPDLFHWLLSGVACNEFTNATTTQCYNPETGDWARPLLTELGIPERLFHPVSMPGSVLGDVRTSVRNVTGLPSGVRVVLPGTHDTASAVMAVPTDRPVGSTDWAYVSLGTWALMGIESPRPIVNDTVAGFNFTNEGGVGGTMRILKNICGLWLIQECRRVWNLQGRKNSSGGPLDWEDLNQMTAAAKPLQFFIDPDAREFLGPTDMPAAIRAFAKKTNQPVPENEGGVLRGAIDSIAMKFRHALEMCESISGDKVKTLHIVGGGIRNQLLCQAAANATGCRVVTGPVEATAIGNVMMQAVASGEVANIEEARRVVRDSFEVVEYEPQDQQKWSDAWPRFLEILGR